MKTEPNTLATKQFSFIIAPKSSLSISTYLVRRKNFILDLMQKSDVLTVKEGSHRSRQRQRYRSVAVTSNVKVFTQKILAVTEVIFSISSVLR